MAVRVNPMLIDELERYGAEDVSKCFHCGNCTAACQFSQGPHIFPRKTMRYLQMGFEKRLRSALDPWLCYYCGDCSEQCPRGAEPGETMMSMRRWLTAQYDFTGISSLFYRSWKVEFGAIVLVAILTCLGFLGYGFHFGGGNLSVYDGPGAFLPAHVVHIFDWTMGSTLGILLGINCLRMWYFVMRGERSLPVSLGMYLRHIPALGRHFFTQKRYSECHDKRPWKVHLALMLSYITMLVLIMFFLREMQYGPEVRWRVHAFAYAATIGLITTAAISLYGRIRKSSAHHQHSHESDWMFLVLLLFVAVTGVVQHVLHRAGLPMAANIAYIVHLMGVVPMLTLEVPFSKWSHMAFRPLAMYFASMQVEAHAAAQTASGGAAEPADANCATGTLLPGETA
jgi:quinone-modifying oxidoreductase, subunit QmoC